MSVTHVVSFSGGRTSAYLVHLMEQRRKAGEDVRYVFMDTGAEHPGTYKFIREVVSNWGIDLICLRVDVNPELGKGNGSRNSVYNQGALYRQKTIKHRNGS